MIDLDLTARAGAFALRCAFAAPTPGIISVFGPSGAGKTTLLRAIAGLTPAEGRIDLDNASLAALKAEERRIGYVFQDARLFPHLSVRENLLYGFARAADPRLHLDEAAAVLGIAGLLDRGVRALSGGERQRVALGRALLSQPRVVLMDEPLAGVDIARKGEILGLIRSVQARFALTILHVSHDLDEVAALADHVALIEQGAISRRGPARALFLEAPLSHRPDARSLIDGRVAAQQDGVTIVEAGETRLVAPRHEGEAGARVRLQVYARDVTLALKPPEAVSTRNIVPATITALETRIDGQALVRLETPAGPLLSAITRDAVSDLKLAPGLALFALVKAVAVK
ncbi:MAG: molybdenum ABC transporter ATP-binding protein [Hyphomonadaceae bacterium]|nr:molybdenum ABC transporter ATP-binding protein [Hyphomonadaceae bacterium]